MALPNEHDWMHYHSTYRGYHKHYNTDFTDAQITTFTSLNDEHIYVASDTGNWYKSVNGLAVLITSGGGEANTSSNVGSGEGLALAKVGFDLPFKSLTAGANITLTPNATEIEISAIAGAGVTASDGIVVTAANVTLGSAISGSGTHDFTADRFQYLDTFNYQIDSSTGNVITLDGSTNRIGIGIAAPLSKLHVYGIDGSTTLESTGSTVALNLTTSVGTGGIARVSNSIWFNTPDANFLFYELGQSGQIQVYDQPNNASGYLRRDALDLEDTGGTSSAFINADGDSYLLGGSLGIGVNPPLETLHVGTGNIRISSLTASEIVATDASSNLQTLDVATYPSLVELSYVKGVTSGIQAQIDAITTGFVDGSGTPNEITYWVDADTVGSLTTATYPSLTELTYLKGVTSAIQTQVDGKANTTLSNLASVAINTSLISDTDSTDNLGSTTIAWANLYVDNIRSITGNNLTLYPATNSTVISGTANKLFFNSLQMLYAPEGNFLGTIYIGSDGGGSLSYTAGNDGKYNTYVGRLSGNTNSTGNQNTGVGNNALGSITTGTLNVGIGSSAAYSTTISTNNTAVGASALYTHTNSGGSNTAIGASAAYNNNAASITAIGARAMYSNTSGSQNIAIGFDALYSNQTGTGNLAIGNESLRLNTVTGNLAIGYRAGYTNSTGVNNLAIGYEALYLNNTTSYNVAMGYRALRANVANYNTAIGASAMYSNQSGTSNVAIGNTALYTNVSGANNVAIGYQALNLNTASSNVAIGTQSMQSNASGTNNVAIGYLSMAASLTGDQNIAIGQQALRLGTDADDNVALGYFALANTTGDRNVALGSFAGQTNTSGTDNIFIGYAAGATSSTSSNIVAIGRSALTVNTAQNNVAIGTDALSVLTTGATNTALGNNAGRYITGVSSNQTSNTSVYLGADTRASANGNSNEIVIGYNTDGLGSNTVTLGNSSIVGTYLKGKVAVAFTTTPTAKVHIAAGSATAATAPLKFTSGTLMGTAEAGAIEFLTDDFYGTITTGAARKKFVLDDGVALTSGRVPFATTNGRLTDDADLTFATDTLTATKVKVGSAGGYITNDGSTGLSDTYTFGGGTSGEVATLTFKDGILTGATLVP